MPDYTAIDLKEMEILWNETGSISALDFQALLATIEALRERVAELETERDLAVAHDRQPYPTAAAYEAVCEARNKWKSHADTAEAKIANMLDGEMKLSRRLEAAEAHTAELAGALEAIIRLIPHPPSKTTPRYADRIQELARAALAATPAEALERARAKDEVLRWAKELCWDDTIYAFKELEEALAKLDALDRKETS